MADPNRQLPQPVPATSEPAAPAASTSAAAGRTCKPDNACDRCGAGMFRMHAVWRCPQCGYKTDCCGW